MDPPAPRLVLASPSTFRGGCEEYSLTIASAARERGYRVVAALPFRTETQTLIEDFRSRRIEYRPLEIAEDPEAARSSVSRHASRLVRSLTLLARVRPSVVLLALPWPTYGFGTIVACRLLRIPLAVVFQLAALPFAFSRAKLDIYRWARRGPQQWVAVSEHNRTILQQSFRLNPEDIRLVRNAARMPPTEAVADPSGLERVRADVRRELGYDDRDLILFTVGRLHAQKGYVDLISATRTSSRSGPTCALSGSGRAPIGRRSKPSCESLVSRAGSPLGDRSRCSSISGRGGYLRASDPLRRSALFGVRGDDGRASSGCVRRERHPGDHHLGCDRSSLLDGRQVRLVGKTPLGTQAPL